METADLYHAARLSGLDLGVVRSPGPGLGNLLLPISRALIGRHKHNGRFVWPTMRQIKVGPVLRWENDFRTYGGVLRPRSREDWQTWIAAGRRPSVSEGDYVKGREGVTIRYAGLGSYFHDIVGHSALLKAWLESARRPDVALCDPYDIAIHVRLGDFSAGNSAAATFNVRQEIDWYRRAFKTAAGQASTPTLRVRLFTDGDSDDVARQIGLTGPEHDRSVNALTAILNLSRAKAIITSRSTFSMWGVFLAQAHAYWDERFDLKRTFPLRPSLDEFVAA
jgi:hypothetical protein